MNKSIVLILLIIIFSIYIPSVVNEDLRQFYTTVAAPNEKIVIPSNGTYKCRVGPKPISKVGDVVLGIVWWHIPKELEGKIVIISADTGNHSDFTIEIWSGYIPYDETEWWAKYTPLVAQTQHMRNPTLVWRMRAGNYTLAFAHWPHTCGCNEFEIEITYNVTILEKGEWFNWMNNLYHPYVKIKLSQMPSQILKEGFVALLVKTNEYKLLKKWIDTYIRDVGFKYGAEIRVFTGSFKNIHEVRNLLRQLYFNTTPRVKGAILVGNMPFPLMGGVTDDNKTYSYYSTRYYEDLDGYFHFNERGWIDWWNNTNGLEIWVAMIRPPSAFPISYLQKYFEKLHAYYAGLIRIPHRALVAVDKDWRGGVANLVDEVLTVYKDYSRVDVIGGFESDYSIHGMEFKHYLLSGYELTTGWIHGGFSFAGGGGESFEGRNHEGSRRLKPGSLVYVMSTCGFTNFNESYCHALSFIIGDGYTLTTIGSTKSEGILETWMFYWKLGEGLNIGDSFLYWLNYRFTDDPWTQQTRFYINSVKHSWGLGVVIYGDPLLVLRGLNTYFEYTPVKVDPGVSSNITVRLVDEHGNPVAGVETKISVKTDAGWREMDVAKTDANGVAVFTLPPLKQGIYDIAFYHNGNENYKPALTYGILYVGIDPEHEDLAIKEIHEKFIEMRIREGNKAINLYGLNITVEVEDSSSVQAVWIKYTLNGSSPFMKSMVKNSGNTFSAYIPGRDTTKIRYEVILLGKKGNTYVSESRELVFAEVRENPLLKTLPTFILIAAVIAGIVFAIILQSRKNMTP